MNIDELLQQSNVALSDPIELFARGDFRWGRLQAILYDPRRTDIFVQPFLFSLYERTRLSGQRHPLSLDLTNRATLGSLPTLFCGMANLGPDAITKYLAERAVCVVGEWRENSEGAGEVRAKVTGGLDTPAVVEIEEEEKPEVFHPLGYCFPSTLPALSEQSKTGIPSNSVFAGYTMFSECWRKPSQQVLMYLGLAWLFHTFRLAALHGSRYEINHLTARWTRQFGFRDCGTLPYCMNEEPGGPLVPGVFSTLLRADFEERLRGVLQKVKPSSD